MHAASATRSDPASFRDPSGVVFYRHGCVLRQVNSCYQADYDLLLASGLYQELVDARLLLAHEEAPLDWSIAEGAYKVLRPTQLPFISYPYEWSFSQLRDAALGTLECQRRALHRGMTLKDASAYNWQLHAGRQVLIDTLSFERYEEGRPWVAYRQFCQHFLAPLALISRRDIRLGQLLRIHIDGIPLDLASALLPLRTKLSLSLGLHIHAHARSQQKHAHDAARSTAVGTTARLSRRGLEALLAGLEAAVRSLPWNDRQTQWADYYAANNNYSAQAMLAKEQIVGDLLRRAAPRSVWDLGANDGRFSRIAKKCGAETVVAWDIDPACVQRNYQQVTSERESGLYPLLLDLTNPTPGVGWANTERASLADRGPVDAVLALGLVHHLAISNNVPLAKIATYLAQLASWLIIEWVPKDDSQVQKLLATRKDVFGDYDQAHFEHAFQHHFALQQAIAVAGTERTLYLFRRLGESRRNHHFEENGLRCASATLQPRL